MAIKDITFIESKTEDSLETLVGPDAVAIAIRNLLLSEEGVFANLPSLQMSVSTLLFDQLGDDDIYQLKNNIYRGIVEQIPNLTGIALDIKKIELEKSYVDGATAIGISIINNETEESYDMIVFKSQGETHII